MSYIIILVVVVVLSFIAGYGIAQSTPVRNIYLENLPSTTLCIMETDGSGTYWATNSSGKVISISDSAATVYNECKSLVTSNGGGTIFFRKGTYVFPTTLTLVDNLVIRGEDPTNTIITLEETPSYTNTISGVNVNNVTISDIAVRLRENSASTGIRLSEKDYGRPRNIRIEHVHFYGGNPGSGEEIGIYMRGVEGAVVSRSYFENVQNIFECTYCTRVSITGNIVNGSGGTRQLLLSYSSDTITVSDNEFLGTLQSSTKHLVEIALSYNIVLRDNVFRGVHGKLLNINGSSHDILFSGNDVSVSCSDNAACRYIYVDDSNTLQFTGNNFKSNILNYVNSEEWLVIDNSANIDLESNHFQLSSYNALSAVVANISRTTDVFVANNRVEDGPIIYIGDGCSRVTLTNNMVSSPNLYAPGSNKSAVLSPSDDDENYLYEAQGTVFLEDKPLTATCIIETDGNGNYWALTGHGKIIESTDAKQVYDKCRDIIAAKGGGKIFFRKGVYTLSDTILLTHNIVLQGEGKENTVLKLDESSGSINVIAGIDVSRVTIEDVGIVLRRNTVTRGIFIDSSQGYSSYIRIRNIFIFGPGSPNESMGVYLNHVWTASIKDSEIKGNIIWPISCNNSEIVVFKGNLIDGGGPSPVAITIDNSVYVTVKDNYIRGFTANPDTPGSVVNVRGSEYVDIVGNIFKDMYNMILLINDSVQIRFSDNNVVAYCNSQSGRCWRLITLNYTSDTRVSDNTLRTRIDPANLKTFVWIKVNNSLNTIIDSNDINSSGNPIIHVRYTEHLTISSNNMNTTNTISGLPALYLDWVEDTRIINNMITAPGISIVYVRCTTDTVVVSNNVLVGSSILYPGTMMGCILLPSSGNLDYNDLNYIRSSP